MAPFWNRATVHTRLVVMTKTLRCCCIVAATAAITAFSLAAPPQRRSTPRPAVPSTTTSTPAKAPESLVGALWCPDEALIQHGQFYAWMVRRC